MTVEQKFTKTGEEWVPHVIVDAGGTGEATEPFFLLVAKGQITGHSSTIIRGHNDNLALDTQEDLWESGGELTYLTTAETMNIVSTDADDDAGDTGATLVSVQGVDNTGAAITENVIMNGTSNVLTTLSYLRVNAMVVLTAGSSGHNEGVITATASSAATVQCQMNTTESLSQNSHYTVPLGVTGYLLRVELNCAKISGGGSPEVEFRGFARPGGSGRAWLQLFDKTLDTSVTDELDLTIPVPSVMIARTDIRFAAISDTGTAEARTRMYLLLVDD